jgi:hypothetical protein
MILETLAIRSETVRVIAHAPFAVCGSKSSLAVEIVSSASHASITSQFQKVSGIERRSCEH